MDASELKKFKVAELKERLTAAGMSTAGRKDELVQRLLEQQPSDAVIQQEQVAAVEEDVVAAIDESVDGDEDW
jgi:hypothetical protein